MDFTFVQLYLSRNSKYWISQELSDFHIKFRMNKFDEFQNRFNSPTSARTFPTAAKISNFSRNFPHFARFLNGNFPTSDFPTLNFETSRSFQQPLSNYPLSHFWATNKPFEIIICFREVHWDDHSTLINQNNLVLSNWTCKQLTCNSLYRIVSF